MSLPQLPNVLTTWKKWLFYQFCVQLWGSEEPILCTHSNIQDLSYITLPLPIKRLGTSCQFVKHWSLWMIASACYSRLGLTGVTERSEWEKSGSSALVLEAVTLFAQQPMLLLLMYVNASHQLFPSNKEFFSLLLEHTHHWDSTVRHCCCQLEIFTAVYINARNFQFV